MKQHGIADVHWTDSLRAMSVYASIVDRTARNALRSNASSKSQTRQSEPHTSQALPVLQTPYRKDRFSRYRNASFHTLPPESPPDWSPPGTPRRCSSVQLRDLPEQPPTDHSMQYNSRWSLPSDALPKPSPNENIDGTHLESHHIQLLYHMLRHAESIYGLPLTVASSPGISLTRLTDRGIICKRTGVKPSDIVHAEFATEPFLPAFYVAIDHGIKAIVVCVRGTANLFDSLTDVAATHDPLVVREDPSCVANSPMSSGNMSPPATSLPNLERNASYVSGYGHSGILRSARKVFEKIRKDVITKSAEYPNYQVVLTGHSLGAATASVLALLMRDDDECPRPFAVAFAPPPCLTYDLAEQTASLGVTVVNGPDIVPRLSVAVMLPLFATMRHVANLSRRKKSLLSLGIRRSVIDFDELEKEIAKETVEMEKMHDGQRLFIPGRVVQLVPSKETRRWDGVRNTALKRREVSAERVSRARFLHVRARERRMFLAHAPFSYRAKLALALKKYGEKPHHVWDVNVILKQLHTEGSNVWTEFCRGRDKVVPSGQGLLESVVDNFGSSSEHR